MTRYTNWWFVEFKNIFVMTVSWYRQKKTSYQSSLILGGFLDELFSHLILSSTFILGELFFDTFFNYQKKWKRVNSGENCISLSESDKREN